MAEYNNRVRKQILSKILILTETEHQEIFKILRNVNIPFTQNCNGVFLNFSLVPNNVVQSIDEFVNFCLENKKELDEYDKRINECKINKNYSAIFPKQIDNDGPIDNCENQLQSKSLQEVIEEQSKKGVKNDWQRLLQETKHTEKLTSFVNMLEDNLEKIVKKRTNTKYINAKKKYSRKVLYEKKLDGNDTSNILVEDQYLIYI